MDLTLTRKIEDDEKTLPRLFIEKEGYSITENPFEVYMPGFVEKPRKKVNVIPIGEPVLIICGYQGTKTANFWEINEAGNGRISRLPRDLDPVGFEARQYAQEKFESLDNLAYLPGQSSQLLEANFTPIQFYRVSQIIETPQETVSKTRLHKIKKK